MSAKKLDLRWVLINSGIHFCNNFHYISRTAKTFYFATSIKRERRFCMPTPPIFESIFCQNSMFFCCQFSSASFFSYILYFLLFYAKMTDLGSPFAIHWACNGSKNLPSGAQRHSSFTACAHFFAFLGHLVPLRQLKAFQTSFLQIPDAFVATFFKDSD